MRIMHTSDWHVGRRWKGLQRLDEMETILDHLARFVERESIDLVLHSGDVFDSRNPTGEAERMVNEFLVRVGRTGARTVLIAGNHDDPQRFDARALLAAGVNVHIVGRPRPADRGGAFMLETRSGAKAVVAALPFASPGVWVSALDLAGDEASARGKYARMFQRAVESLCSAYCDDAVNLLLAHTHLEGAVFGESERRVHLSEDWAATPQTLTVDRDLHRARPHPQAAEGGRHAAGLVRRLTAAARLRRGRPGEDLRRRRSDTAPPGTRRARALRRGTVAPGHRGNHGRIGGLRRRTTGDDCWLRVTVKLTEKDPDINRKVREILPNALVVRVDLPQAEVQDSDRPGAGAPATELYAAYHRRAHEREPEPMVLDTFGHLHEQAREDA